MERQLKRGEHMIFTQSKKGENDVKYIYHAVPGSSINNS